MPVINCNFKDSEGDALFGADVVITPVSTPLAATPDVVSGVSIKRKVPSSGTFQLTLSAGRYVVVVNNKDRFYVTVAAAGGPYNLEALMDS